MEVVVRDVKTRGILDTGSQITTVSESFIKSLPNTHIEDIEGFLQVEVASGHELDYLGVAVFPLSFPDFAKQMDSTEAIPVVVVKDTSFNKTVPFIIGTNVILHCFQKLKGQKSESSQWNTAFQCVSTSPSFSTVSCTKQVVIPPHSAEIVKGLTRWSSPVRSFFITEATSDSQLPLGLSVTPVYYSVDPCILSFQRIGVRIENFTDHPINIPRRTVLCQLQPAKSVDLSSSDTSSGDQDFLSQFTVGDNLSSEQKDSLFHLISKWKHIFSQHDLDYGRTNLMEHEIHLTDRTPFKGRHHSIPPHLYQEVRDHLQEMLKADIIRPSKSPYSSPIVLVRKRDGKLRFCVDFRTLNSRTIKDAHALPRIEETLDSLQGASFFSSLDLKAGYWQVPLKECDKPLTAFTAGNLGFWEFNFLPFGLCNAPACFQRLMMLAMGDLHLKECLLYLDDIIIFSKTFEEHLTRLESVFQRLHAANLKLKASKCHFLHRKIKYLGHIVSSEGIQVDPEKTSVVQDWPVPKTVKQLRGFLGFSGFYRRFIRSYSKIARPLHDLLKAPPPGSPKSFKWEQPQQQAFDKLKDLLCSAPVLTFADFSKPFILHTDASDEGLGAILYQDHDSQERPVAFASRSLSPSEQHYPAHKKEFLALKWAISDKFRDYLLHCSFIVRTDNNPLTYILTSAKLDATGQRWVAELSQFNFSISYRSGRENIEADFLSRPFSSQDRTIPSDVVSALCSSPQMGWIHAFQLTCDPTFPCDLSPSLSSPDWKVEQRKDAAIFNAIQVLEGKKKPSAARRCPGTLDYLRQRKRLTLRNNILYRERTVDGNTSFQLVVPIHFQQMAMKGIHDDVGHLGIDRSTQLLRERFFWPNMSSSIREHVAQCTPCLLRKRPPHRAPLINIPSSQPLELVCMDYLTLEPSKGKFENVLIITDHFTKYAVAIPTRNQTAKTTATALFNHFINHYGFPLRLHSDQGQNFLSRTIKELCQLAHISQSRTSPYHAMGNGLCERYNRTLMNMLATLPEAKKTNWKDHVATVTHAYNSTQHDSTGVSPFFLMYGRQPRLPIDLFFGHEPNNSSSDNYSTFVKHLRQRLSEAYKLAQDNIKKAQAQQKTNYDLRQRGAKVQPGDRVLVQKVGFKGRHKLANFWESSPYVIIDQPNVDIPVFTVQREDKVGRLRTLHRNLLLPIGNIPIQNQDNFIVSSPKRRRNLRRAVKGNRRPASSSDSSSSDDDFILIPAPTDSADESNALVHSVHSADSSTSSHSLASSGGDDHSSFQSPESNLPLSSAGSPERPSTPSHEATGSIIPQDSVDSHEPSLPASPDPGQAMSFSDASTPARQPDSSQGSVPSPDASPLAHSTPDPDASAHSTPEPDASLPASENEDHEDDKPVRTTRTRRPPAWMRTGDWYLGSKKGNLFSVHSYDYYDV